MRRIKKNEILWSKLNQGVKDLFTESYKTLLKEIKDTNKWENTAYDYGLEDLILYRCCFFINLVDEIPGMLDRGWENVCYNAPLRYNLSGFSLPVC